MRICILMLGVYRVTDLTCALLLQFGWFKPVVGAVVANTVLFVGGSLSSSVFVKSVLYKTSWNSFANNADCFSGFIFSSSLSSQVQVKFFTQFPAEFRISLKTNQMLKKTKMCKNFASRDKKPTTVPVITSHTRLLLERS